MKILVSLFSILSFLSLTAWSQNTKAPTPCDSLVGKPYYFIYQEADAIVEGLITDTRIHSDNAIYKINSSFNYKGSTIDFELGQKNNPHWFPFAKDSSYVFLIYENYEDPIFSPCILFSKKGKMDDFLDYTFTKCSKTKILPDNMSCTKELNPVCGCDGVEYGNPCMAQRAGISTWNYGKCGK